jgi:hypothetical protein
MYYQLITTSFNGDITALRQYGHTEHAAARADAKDQVSLPETLEVRLLAVESAETFYKPTALDAA